MNTQSRLFMWAALAAVAFTFSTGSSSAEDVSPWDADTRSAIRLIAGSNSGGASVVKAGIELRIDAGWKTYWRYAGDSGLPPAFDFAESENVQTITLLWPAPRRFPDGAGGNSIGYTGGVVFPVQAVAQDPTKPVTLRVKANYGVCEKICVPAIGKAELRLASNAESEVAAAVTAAEARVPKAAELGEAGRLIIHSVHRQTGRGERPRVIVEVTAPEGANVDLFAEGPAPQWSLPLPEPAGNAPEGKRRFAFEVDGVPPGARIDGALIRLTLISDDDAIEVTTHLD
jgi:DsbC/DsbD-like thiol-disulfide interchange protein